MTRGTRALLLAGVGVAAAAVAAAFLHGEGDLDSPRDPEPRPLRPPASPRAGRLPPLRFPEGFPAAAAAALEEARLGAAGDDRAAVLALDALDAPATRAAIRPAAGAALEAFLPCLAVLLEEPDGAVAGAALRCVARLALDGGPPARAMLDRSGFVLRSLVPRALSASAEVREETARLLGMVGGAAAGDRLVVMLADPAPAVAAAAALALGELGDRERRLPRGAPDALVGLFDGSPHAEVRRACLGAFRRAHRLLAPYGTAEREAAALRSPDRALRMEAARNQQAHPSEAAAEALVLALEDPDPRIVEPVADALGALLHVDALEALRRRRATLADPAAVRAVDAAVSRLAAAAPR